MRKGGKLILRLAVLGPDATKNHDLVYTNQYGGYLNQSILRREVKQLLHEAGLPAFHCHNLSHSAATILISMGVNSRVVQERLGHSTISITLGVYGHVTLIDATRCHAEMR